MSNKKGHPGPHKYLRVRLGSKYVWRCVLNCPHFLYLPMMLGREAICWRCGFPFVIGKKEINDGRMVKPHCASCTRRKKPADDDQLLPEEFPI